MSQRILTWICIAVTGQRVALHSLAGLHAAALLAPHEIRVAVDRKREGTVIRRTVDERLVRDDQVPQDLRRVVCRTGERGSRVRGRFGAHKRAGELRHVPVVAHWNPLLVPRPDAVTSGDK